MKQKISQMASEMMSKAGMSKHVGGMAKGMGGMMIGGLSRKKKKEMLKKIIKR